jgi:hypothetical protein
MANFEAGFCPKNYVVQRLDLTLLPSSLPAGSETPVCHAKAHGDEGEKSR